MNVLARLALMSAAGIVAISPTAARADCVMFDYDYYGRLGNCLLSLYGHHPGGSSVSPLFGLTPLQPGRKEHHHEQYC